MRKPNYPFERAERDRLRKAKKEEKLQRRQQERAAERAADGTPQPTVQSQPPETRSTPLNLGPSSHFSCRRWAFPLEPFLLLTSPQYPAFHGDRRLDARH